jgi:hypothetical protein
MLSVENDRTSVKLASSPSTITSGGATWLRDVG